MTINVFEENGTAVVAPVGKIDHVTVQDDIEHFETL